MATECECPVAGFCKRHNCTKSELYHSKCQSRPDWFDMWERGQGPGQVHSNRATHETFACIHRGEEIRKETCALCGGREDSIPIFSCDQFGECSIGRFKNIQITQTCIGCPDRSF